MLNIGTKVRLKLDAPVNYLDNKRLIGKFRAGDIRWTKEIYTIIATYLTPSNPVMYAVKDSKGVIIKGAVYTRYELKPV